MESKIKELIVEGAKYTASSKFENAAKCYIEILDSLRGEDQEDEEIDPEYLLLLASCLYELGVERSGMFGDDNGMQGYDDNGVDQEGESDESDEEGGSDEEDEDDGNKKPKLNENLYQFDNEEEDLAEEEEEEAAKEEEEVVSGEEEMSEEEEEEGEEEADQEPLPFTTFKDYLEGDIFYNTLELLQVARSNFELLRKTSKDERKLIKKIGQTNELLGDVYQELEQFKESIELYESSIENYKSLDDEQNIEIQDKISSIIFKLVESLTWYPDESGITRTQRIELLEFSRDYLKKCIDQAKTKNIEECKNQLSQIEVLLDELKTGKKEVKGLNNALKEDLVKNLVLKRLMGFDIPTSEDSAQNVNDLTSIVKKKKPRNK
ncbi:hypothetical protein Kpol_1054p17 [Vanderwaltozyma polyspora DSM 70294]|uniref:Tetratricopeptide SHNi-TPR domain-containing protein n=1 Tax=Vanderwaltozyma polyspora (strain ATCC 22028 / DSM 70294 / BCRC 21397 / CBS 2163 / NBRC 10782 / NRRL Y-8283 / UCD 57-17) TaxID=436907 RepID=A7TIA4_VANPO|nr:uncharacterized protein Kpol_1054p17 [Vanderwaltozyma polyspora DSM 70294]EDO17970.1 hypothetical protein Kpol_1054p17 [Vanderwaltozyma polyspora DSM 70294]